jgi:hypothetical protein
MPTANDIASNMERKRCGPDVDEAALAPIFDKRVLGKIPPGDLPNDPFWLPGKTVDIDVVSTGAAFAATVRTLEPSDAQQIVDRTRAFLESGPGPEPAK